MISAIPVVVTGAAAGAGIAIGLTGLLPGRSDLGDVPQSGQDAPAAATRAAIRTTAPALSTPTTSTWGSDGNNNSPSHDHDTVADCQL